MQTQKIPINTKKAPAAIGPYSQALVLGSLLFTSGCIPIDPQTGTIPAGSIEEHTHLVLHNLTAIAEAAGTSLDKTIKVTIFLSDMASFQQVNAVYGQYFTKPYPARSTVQVAALPMNAALELEAIIAL